MDDKELHVSIAVLTKTTSDLASRLERHENRTDSKIETIRKEAAEAIAEAGKEQMKSLEKLEDRMLKSMTSQFEALTMKILELTVGVSELKTVKDKADGAWYSAQITSGLFIKFLTVCTALAGGGYFLLHNLLKIV